MPRPVSSDGSPHTPPALPEDPPENQQLFAQLQELDRRVEGLIQRLALPNQQEIQRLLQSGLDYAERGKLAEAVIQFKAILHQQPNHFEAKAHLKRVYQMQGERFFREEKYMEAIGSYTSGNAFAEVQRVLEKVCAIADAFFENGDFENAKLQYRDVEKSLKELIRLRRLYGTPTRQNFIEYYRTIQEKIKKAEVAALLEGIKPELELLEKAALEEVGQAVAPSLGQLRVHDDILSRIQQLHLQIKAKDPTYSASPQFMELYTRICRQLETAETEQLTQYSLREADDLEPIQVQCERWLSIYEKLGNPPDLAEKQQIIQHIKVQAEFSLKKLSELESIATQALSLSLRRKNHASVSDSERTWWIAAFMEKFSNDGIRNRFVSLTFDGHIKFRELLQEYLVSHLDRTSWIPPFCCYDAKYKISSYPSMGDIEDWLDDLLEGWYCVKDIQELDLPPPYREGEVDEGGAPPPSDGEGEEGVSSSPSF